jgi:flagellar basal-body rod modification protein FlgD
MDTSTAIPAQTTGTQSSASPQTTGAKADDSAAASAGISADFTTFLTLLTSQLRNQDPLNPVDSTEFVAQLASFSAVEQQTRTNQLLEELIAGAAPNDGIGAVANWIGMRVASPGGAAFQGGEPVEFVFDPPAGADAAFLAIRDDFGLTVATLAVEPGADHVSWDGTTSDGSTAPAGLYTGEITHFSENKLLSRASARTFSEVTEVRLKDGAAILTLANGSKILSAEVREARAAEPG